MLLKKKQIIQKFLVVCIGVGNVGDDVPDLTPRFFVNYVPTLPFVLCRAGRAGATNAVVYASDRIVLIDHFGLPSAIGLSGFPLQT